jgi:hypothetical protein
VKTEKPCSYAKIGKYVRVSDSGRLHVYCAGRLRRVRKNENGFYYTEAKFKTYVSDPENIVLTLSQYKNVNK